MLFGKVNTTSLSTKDRFLQKSSVLAWFFFFHRMAIYLRREPKTRLWGILFGFQIRFNKRGKF